MGHQQPVGEPHTLQQSSGPGTVTKKKRTYQALVALALSATALLGATACTSTPDPPQQDVVMAQVEATGHHWTKSWQDFVDLSNKVCAMDTQTFTVFARGSVAQDMDDLARISVANFCPKKLNTFDLLTR